MIPQVLLSGDSSRTCLSPFLPRPVSGVYKREGVSRWEETESEHPTHSASESEKEKERIRSEYTG